MDKQIEELKSILNKPCSDIVDKNMLDISECPLPYDCAECTAFNIYKAGYRKQEDVAREIFAEIEKLMTSLDKRHMQAGNPKQAWGIRNVIWEIAELKKKYIGEQE